MSRTEYPIAGLGSTNCSPGGGMTDAQRKAVLECVEAGPVTPLEPDWGAKAELRKLACYMDQGVREGIKSATLTGREHVIFRRISVASATSVDVFADTDSRAVNVGNLAKGVIPPNKAFILDGIQLLYDANATAADLTFGDTQTTDTNAAAGTANTILSATEFPAAIRNGWIKEFKIDNVVIWEELPLMALFTASSNETGRPNFWRLAFPILMNADSEIRLRLEFAAAAAANSSIWCGLYGAITRNQHLSPKA